MHSTNERNQTMKTTPSLASLALALLVLGMMMGGCGKAIYEVVEYYNPNWLPDGRIIATKSVEKYEWEGSIPGFATSKKYFDALYIASMKDDGSDEQEIYGGENKNISIITASPLGNYIGYKGGQYINIISADGTRDIKTIDCGETVSSFDWSPDETRITYSLENSKDLYVINIINDIKAKIATSAESVAWRVGELIAFVKYGGIDYSKLATIYANGTSEAVLSLIGQDAQKDNAKLYYRGRKDIGVEGTNAVRSANLDGSGDALIISNYERSTMKLSFDNSKIVGGDLDQRSIKGIWVVNIDGTGLKKLRD